jgi:pSer/pThr/pTyr-binding forkhead associated (FHA) protein
LEIARNTPLDKTVQWRPEAESTPEPMTSDVEIPTDLRMTTIAEDSEEEAARRTEAIGTDRRQDPESEPIDPSEAAQIYRPRNRPPMAFLKFYADGSRLFSPIPITSDVYVIGRSEGDLKIAHDLHISSRHAEIRRVSRADGSYQWDLVDLESTNGTFVCVDHVILKPNDEVLIGQEKYRFICQQGRAGFELVADDRDETYLFRSDVVWLGRAIDDTMQSMRQDTFVDPSHAIVRWRNGFWLLINNDSLNGVWYRVEQVTLASRCRFQLGEQRLGFRI